MKGKGKGKEAPSRKKHSQGGPIIKGKNYRHEELRKEILQIRYISAYSSASSMRKIPRQPSGQSNEGTAIRTLRFVTGGKRSPLGTGEIQFLCKSTDAPRR